MFNRIAVAGLLLLTFSTVAVARYIQWKPAEKPLVSLKEALDLADGELGMREGKLWIDELAVGTKRLEEDKAAAKKP